MHVSKSSCHVACKIEGMGEPIVKYNPMLRMIGKSSSLSRTDQPIYVHQNTSIKPFSKENEGKRIGSAIKSGSQKIVKVSSSKYNSKTSIKEKPEEVQGITLHLKNQSKLKQLKIQGS